MDGNLASDAGRRTTFKSIMVGRNLNVLKGCSASLAFNSETIFYMIFLYETNERP